MILISSRFYYHLTLDNFDAYGNIFWILSRNGVIGVFVAGFARHKHTTLQLCKQRAWIE